jgi:clan AA aspartic protease (TIGR02281 family)
MCSTALNAEECKVEIFANLMVTIEQGRAVVNGQINSVDQEFILDSGAFYSEMSESKARSLGLTINRLPSYYTVSGAGGNAQFGVTSVRDLEFAGHKINNIEFLVGGTDSSKALIGQNLLGFADTEYDLSHGLIHLVHAKNCNNTSLAYWPNNGNFSVQRIEAATAAQPHINTEVVINGTKLRAFLDTGAPVTVITLKSAKRAGLDVDAPNIELVGTGGGIGSNRFKTWRVPVATVKIGNEEIRNVHLIVADTNFGADMLLGLDFFLSHHIYVANGQRNLYFTYNGGAPFGADAGRNVKSNTAADELGELASADAYDRRGTAFAGRNDYTHAISDLTKAIGLASTTASYYYHRAQVESHLHQLTLALKDADEAVRLAPNDIPAHILRAAMRLAVHDRSGALDDAKQLDRLLPPHDNGRIDLAEKYVDANEPMLALRNFDAWIAGHVDDANMSRARAGRCLALGLTNTQLDEAMRECTRSLKIDPKNPYTLRSLGLLHYRLKSYSQALAELDQVIVRLPNAPWALYIRGLTKVALGHADGLVDITRAKADDPTIAESAAHLGL